MKSGFYILVLASKQLYPLSENKSVTTILKKQLHIELLNPNAKPLPKMLTKIVLFIQCLLVCSFTYAQIDREFWFAAPDVYAHTMNYDKPIVVRMTTFAAPATVTISIPANPAFIPIVTNIPANATTSVDLTTWINLIENSAINTPDNKGLLIQSTADITAYYEVVSSYCVCNPEIFALKGKNGLGTEFYISAQNTYAIDTVRHPGANASFDIVAAEDNTIITITPSTDLIGHPAGIPFTITLNKGQTFSNVGKYRDKNSQLNGSYISSSKPIAVTLKGDLTFGDGACADLIGDQTVPTNVLGNEYIVTKGYLMPADRVFILAVEDNTSVFLDGSPTPAATLSKGQTYSFSLTNNSSYIRADKKIYIYQVTGNGCELGSAIIPKLNCTGSQSVSIVRSSNETFAVVITLKNGAQNSFTVNGNSSLITAANFSPVPGTGGNYVSARVDLSASISTGSVVNISNTAGKFSLGFINGTPVGGCRYGFFSDFKSSNVQESQVEICEKDSTQLSAFGGVTYQWSPAIGLSSTLIANPKASPAVTTDYTVIITDANGCIDSAFVKVVVKPKPVVNLGPDISVCQVNNLVLDAGNAGSHFLWQDGSAAQTFAANTFGKYYVKVANAFSCVNSDTIIIYKILTDLPDFYFKQDVCNPLAVQFFSVGNNLVNPYWNFGEGNAVTGNFNATHTYPAFGNYMVKFGVETGSCKDTITKTIAIDVTDADIVLTKDTTICISASVPLKAQPSLSFCWSPTTGLTNSNTITPIASPTQNTTYYYTAEVSGTNLVRNGNFNNGNVDFGSQYAYTTTNGGEGEYTVTASPKSWNNLLGACTDHTTGTGNMLLINGATQANRQVWTQTINVTPNTNYAFSAWMENANVNGAGSNPPQLQFSINGNNIGNILQGRQQMCIWEQFYSVWNSGNNTTATIAIVNQNTVASGNDYALDDIQFAELKILHDSVKVNVTPCTECDKDWLQLNAQPAQVNLGDLDIAGNQVTVEAKINRTTTYDATYHGGDVVSKHDNPNDVNYLLRPNIAAITTTNGYYQTPGICNIELNKTYHIAMVYDGSTLKFYRDGFLMSQVAATGNLYQNNYPTLIGQYTGIWPEQFVGYVNEVRIWNVARSQADIRTYMNSPLPSPATQTGLQAYYVFDNLINKQGNPMWNATLTGNATLNTANSNCILKPDSCKVAAARFTTPDTVCVNTPVTITNTSTGASSYYWNFCVADINSAPARTNIGNPGNLLTGPVFMDYAYDNGNYYGFVVSFTQARLVRLDYGNSLLNTPTAVNLGNYGGLLQNSGSEGIQVVQNESRWYALIVGGSTVGGTQPRIVKIDFGTNITSPGVATNWGNIGNMNQPIDLHVFKEGNNWFGFTVNSEDNTIIRFNFTNSFNNTPTGTNLGNIGGLAYPTGIYAINDNGFWRVFITNGGDNQRIGTNSSLTRLDFGSSLLNTPTGVNLGNPGNMLRHPRDFTIMKFCGEIVGFAVNGNPNYNDLVRLNFSNNLALTPTATSLGNAGGLNFPHSLSKLFRVNDDVYAFITNVSNNTITRVRFQGCTNASVSSSTDEHPQPVTYSTPGTYNINLTIDDGLPTQTSYCKQVVVLPAPVHTPTQAIDICTGDSIKIGTGVKYAQYSWNTGAVTDSIVVKTAGTYWVQTDRYGCSNRDSMVVTELPKPVVDLGPDASLCTINNMVLDAQNTGATYLWQDGTTNQTYTINAFGKYFVRVTNVNRCMSSDTITLTKPIITKATLNYKQDICNPLSVQFTGSGTGLSNPYWDFGDGSITMGNYAVTHTYPRLGNYTVKFGVSVNGCIDTVTQAVSVNVNMANLIVTPDTTICYNTSKQLRTNQLLGFCWSPSTWLDDPYSPNPVTFTPGKMTYYLTAEVPGANLVANGDFNNGNTGFTSNYSFSNINNSEGEYSIGTNPRAWNGNLGTCTDHTTGNGNMLLVNGAPTPNEVVWSQTINNIAPNTDYAFIAWLQNVNTAGTGSNPPTLQFSINGNPLGNIFQTGITSCIWNRFYIIWNSGNNTSANISVINQNTFRAGNDFALDDISFSPILLQRDSVTISVDTPVVIARADTTICANSQAPLHATGAATWLWSPAAGLTNTTISNPVATPADTTQYIVTGINSYGCQAKDTVNINVFPVPTVITDHDLVACPNTPVQLSANNTLASWSWTPGQYLNNTAVANPTATLPGTLTYQVQVTDANNCTHSDTVRVEVLDTRFTLTGLNRPVCQGASVTLHASGGDSWLWSPAGSLNDATIATPVATPDTSTLYTVYARESNCGVDTTMQVRVTVNPGPVVQASKANDVNCVVHTAQLQASGTPGTSYLWAPVTGLDHPNLPNPVSGPETTTTYFVTGTNQHGCSAVDSVTVYVEAEGKVTFMVPNAFSPNGDGRNDCFGVKTWGGAIIEEFSVFNRWGERVFSSKNATACWDGRFKGELQPAGGYVYVIKAKTVCGHIKRSGTLVLVR